VGMVLAVRGGVGIRRATACLTMAFLLWQIVWAVVTPGFRTPDEPAHYNSVLRMATTGQWPAPGEAALTQTVVDAVRESGLTTVEQDLFSQANRSEVAGGDVQANGGDVLPYPDALVVEHGQRSVGMYSDAEATGEKDQMTQHPPLYYWLAGKALRLAGGMEWTWDRQLLFLRIFSIFLTAPLVPCLVYTACRLGAGRRCALAIAATIFLVPQLAFNTAAVTNDDLAIGAGAVAIAASAAVAYSGSWYTVFASGAALGVGLWSKGTFIPMGLVVGCAFLVNPRIGTRGRRLLRALAAGGVGVLLGGFWWGRNLVLYGVLQPAGLERTQSGEGSDVLYFIQASLRGLADTSWGRLGWLEFPLPQPLLLALQVGVLVCVTWAVTHAWVPEGGTEQARDDRLRRAVLILFYPATGALLIVQAWTAYTQTGTLPGLQGRYLFPAVVGMLAVAGMAWAPRLERTGERNWPYMIPGILSSSVAGYSLLLWLRACYPAEEGWLGIDWLRWSVVSGLGLWWLRLAVVLGAVMLLVAVLTPFLFRDGRARGDGGRAKALSPAPAIREKDGDAVQQTARVERPVREGYRSEERG